MAQASLGKLRNVDLDSAGVDEGFSEVLRRVCLVIFATAGKPDAAKQRISRAVLDQHAAFAHGAGAHRLGPIQQIARCDIKYAGPAGRVEEITFYPVSIFITLMWFLPSMEAPEAM